MIYIKHNIFYSDAIDNCSVESKVMKVKKFIHIEIRVTTLYVVTSESRNLAPPPPNCNKVYMT